MRIASIWWFSSFTALYLRTLELRILFMTNSIYLHFDEDTDNEDFEH